MGFLVFVLIILKSPKDNPDPLIDRAARGASGEEKVAAILDNLPDGYTIFHDLPCPVGNIDHIVVGPTGVFVIETKSHKGTLTVSPQGELRRNGRPLEKDVVNQVWRQTFWLKRTLQTRLGETVFIHPLLVFVNGFIRVYHPVNGVEVLSGKWLLRAILNKTGKFPAQKRDAALKVLHELHSASMSTR